MKVKKKTFNQNKSAILTAAKSLAMGHELHVRKLTGRESLRLMGVDEEYIDRMSNPDKELKKMGYLPSEIDQLLSVDGKRVKVGERELHKQAGNSIVVDVLYHVFKNLLTPACENSQFDVAA